MSNFVDLKIPQAWKPLLKAIADADWEFRQPITQPLDWDCLHILEFARHEDRCYLLFWEEGEWCGNNFHRNALIVAGLATTLGVDRPTVEAHSLPLTGNWIEEVNEYVSLFFAEGRTQI